MTGEDVELRDGSWSPNRKRPLALVLAIGGLLLAAGWGVRAYLTDLAARPEDNAAPPHPVVNAPYIPTPDDVVERMLELAEVGPDDVVYDLGCGDGRIVVAAAKEYGCRCFGFDINPERVAEARDNARREGVEQLVEIGQRDILTLDLSEATVVTMYLLPKLNAALIPQLEKLAPGSRVVSHEFDIDGLVPDRKAPVLKEGNSLATMLYLYTAPLKHRKATK
ncbi:MAG TPA: methyltransferase domain-containing protein [Pirellulales bacterium]|nr:methyltransferase domain-containing protein [Pirellulales bacterium]